MLNLNFMCNCPEFSKQKVQYIENIQLFYKVAQLSETGLACNSRKPISAYFLMA